MPPTLQREFSLFDGGAAIVVALVFILVASLAKEPVRQKFNAIFVAGAGAAYLSGGLGPWEFAFTTVATLVAYKGLASYRFIGLAWMLHVGWDIVHHFYGNPIVSFAPTSSGQCAVCDTLIAFWFFAGAPSVYERRPLATGSAV